MHFFKFAALFACIAQNAHGKITRCPFETLTDMTGEIKIAGYPDEPYPNRYRCRTLIKAQVGYRIEITFKDFQLEPPVNGRRTDSLRVHDGMPGKTKVVEYKGSIEEPFVFLSTSSRVTLVFSSNRINREKGFYATYRQLKEQKSCDYPFIEEMFPSCTEAGDEGFFYCTFECYPGYHLEGGTASFCNTSVGEWEALPSCRHDPAILEICIKDISDFNCLYPPDQLAEYYSTDNSSSQPDSAMTALLEDLGDELDEIEVDDAPSISRTGGRRQLKCHNYLCFYNSAERKFSISCRAYALALQKRKKLNAARTKRAMKHCFNCQNAGCKSVYI